MLEQQGEAGKSGAFVVQAQRCSVATAAQRHMRMHNSIMCLRSNRAMWRPRNTKAG